MAAGARTLSELVAGVPHPSRVTEEAAIDDLVATINLALEGDFSVARHEIQPDMTSFFVETVLGADLVIKIEVM